MRLRTVSYGKTSLGVYTLIKSLDIAYYKPLVLLNQWAVVEVNSDANHNQCHATLNHKYTLSTKFLDIL